MIPVYGGRCAKVYLESNRDHAYGRTAVFRLLSLFIALSVLLAACATTTEPETDLADPRMLLEEAVVQVREAKNFKMLVEQTGAPYPFSILLDANAPEVVAVMQRAEAQFVAPNVIYAKVKLTIGLPVIDIEVFARGSNQWLRLLGTGWLNRAFAEGFNPEVLVAQDSGFQKALSALTDLEFIGMESLLDGTRVYHVRGGAGGTIVKDLLVGLVETEKDVIVDVYINWETKFPELVVVTQPNTATERQPQDTAWRVEVYDVNTSFTLDDPEAK